jgi:recombinational DNA repair protein (RecF pathway)
MTELIDVATHEREPAPELFALFQQALEQLTQTSDLCCCCVTSNYGC